MQWQPFHSTATYLLLAAAVILVLVTARRIAVSQKSRWWVLLLLRGVLLAGLVILLLNPVDRSETVLPPQTPSVALLVDCSQSMALGIGQSRLQRVKRIIDAAARTNGKEPPTRLDLFRFGKHLAKVTSLIELNASDDASLLADALRRLPSRVTSEQSPAVVLFSDGAVPHSEELTEIAAKYRELDVPVHVLVPENDALRGDIAITALSVPRRVTAGVQTTVRAMIDNHGFSGKRDLLGRMSSFLPGHQKSSCHSLWLLEFHNPWISFWGAFQSPLGAVHFQRIRGHVCDAVTRAPTRRSSGVSA